MAFRCQVFLTLNKEKQFHIEDNWPIYTYIDKNMWLTIYIHFSCISQIYIYILIAVTW